MLLAVGLAEAVTVSVGDADVGVGVGVGVGVADWDSVWLGVAVPVAVAVTVDVAVAVAVAVLVAVAVAVAVAVVVAVVVTVGVGLPLVAWPALAVGSATDGDAAVLLGAGPGAVGSATDGDTVGTAADTEERTSEALLDTAVPICPPPHPAVPSSTTAPMTAAKVVVRVRIPHPLAQRVRRVLECAAIDGARVEGLRRRSRAIGPWRAVVAQS